jgi:hypothetical protein
MTRNRDMLIRVELASDATEAEVAEFVRNAVDTALEVHMMLNPRNIRFSPNGETVTAVEEA